MNSTRREMIGCVSAALLLAALCGSRAAADTPTARNAAIRDAQSKIVKIYGAGGFQGLEAYQSGSLISPDGYLLTVWSYVLDTDQIRAVLFDGRRADAKLVGADPWLELAVLKIDAKDLPYFDLAAAAEGQPGDRILALSNLFGVATGNEPVSVQHGTIAVRTDLDARKGVFETQYHGPVYVLDVVTNNPGAAGGMLVTRRGEPLGMLGKELRNGQNNTWLNYAIPVAQLRKSVDDIRAGKFVARQDGLQRKRPEKAASLARLGMRLVPDVVDRTPPFIDGVQSDSPAFRAGLRPDDLIMLIGDRIVQTCKAVRTELEFIDYEDPVTLTVLRGQEIRELTLRPAP